MAGLRRPEGPHALVVFVGGSVARDDIEVLCERVRALLEATDARQVVCDVGALVDPDAVVVDALARLQLIALRLGRGIRLRHACAELLDLLALMGLSDVVPLFAELPLQPEREAEEREQVRRVEEEADPGDPPA